MSDGRKRALNWQMLAEERIQDALASGEFDNLPGLGQPIPGIDEPPDELWWVRQKLRREGLSIKPTSVPISGFHALAIWANQADDKGRAEPV